MSSRDFTWVDEYMRLSKQANDAVGPLNEARILANFQFDELSLPESQRNEYIKSQIIDKYIPWITAMRGMANIKRRHENFK